MNQQRQSAPARLLGWFLRDGQVWITVCSLLFLTYICLRNSGLLGAKP